MDIPVKQITEMQEYYNKTILLLGNYENPDGEMFLESLKTNIERHFSYYGTTVKKLDSVSALLKKTPRQILHFWLSNFAFVIYCGIISVFQSFDNLLHFLKIY